MCHETGKKKVKEVNHHHKLHAHVRQDREGGARRARRVPARPGPSGAKHNS
eukprot:CAMPEP_0202048004 /NCGR_PEP_ID=MMETSP0963-20130614/2374_1 /ASSEMBLY_ACC=CAM_ASM_000494 /TAXON_ID=4773 /ORGANISM="Schizochytrium aggregatum, Strain ATCC28209" /LENGTH=50 /DNA_ID=CAMNT_0048612825 /DNA_START=675 /DNA_END=827 /DNA_ORIENTATION=+